MLSPRPPRLFCRSTDSPLILFLGPHPSPPAGSAPAPPPPEKWNPNSTDSTRKGETLNLPVILSRPVARVWCLGGHIHVIDRRPGEGSKKVQPILDCFLFGGGGGDTSPPPPPRGYVPDFEKSLDRLYEPSEQFTHPGPWYFNSLQLQISNEEGGGGGELEWWESILRF